MSDKRNKTLKMLALAALLAMPTNFANAATSVPESKEYTLEVIHVTAQKRSETQNAVPISLEVKTGEQLETENIKTVKDIFLSTPNVSTGMGSGGTGYTPYFAIRGVGSAENDVEPSVGVFVDGIPMTAGYGFSSNLLDVDQVEILRGPQGTLYGRNTLGGTINITSKKADPSKTEGHISLGGGNKEQINTEIVLNAPLMDGRSAIRGAFAYDHQGEVWENRQDADKAKEENFQGRLSYFQMFGDNTTIDFSADIQKQDHLYTNAMSLNDFNNGNDKVNSAGPTWGGYNNSGGAKLEVNHDFDNGHKLTSITGYRALDVDYDGNYAPVGYYGIRNAGFNASGFTGFQFNVDGYATQDFDQISQEFRWTSADDAPLRYVLGLYGDYNKSKRTLGGVHTWETNPLGFTANYVDLKLTGDQDSISLAAFADASYDFNDAWQVFGGLRIGYDKKDFSFKMRDTLDNTFIPLYGANLILDYEDSMDKLYLLPRLGLKYNINDNNNIYASASRGYKAGGFMLSFHADPSLFPFDEETTMNYELGMKNTFLDGRMTVDSAFFYIDWKDQQILIYDATTTEVTNAPKSRSYGFELDVNGYFDNGIRVGVSAGYSDATYVEFDNATKTIPKYLGNDIFDASGKQQQYHSKFTAQANLGYDFALPWNELIGNIDLTYRYRSKYYFDIENTIEQPAYGTADISFGVENDTYKVDFWVSNLFDVRSYASAVNAGGFYGNLGQDALVTLNDPRMFGATFTIKF